MSNGLNERFSMILKEYFDTEAGYDDKHEINPEEQSTPKPNQSDDNLKLVESLNDQLVGYGFPEIKESQLVLNSSRRTLISTVAIVKELNDFNTTFYYFKNRSKGETIEYVVEITVKFREGSSISKEIGSIIINPDYTIEFYSK